MDDDGRKTIHSLGLIFIILIGEKNVDLLKLQVTLLKYAGHKVISATHTWNINWHGASFFFGINSAKICYLLVPQCGQ